MLTPREHMTTPLFWDVEFDCNDSCSLPFYLLSISVDLKYNGELISNQPNLLPVQIHLCFFDVIAL